MRLIYWIRCLINRPATFREWYEYQPGPPNEHLREHLYFVIKCKGCNRQIEVAHDTWLNGKPWYVLWEKSR